MSDIPTTGFYYDVAKHAYYYNGKLMTGMTTILGVLNKPAFVPWAARMAVEYIEKNGSPEWDGDINDDDKTLEGYSVSLQVLEEAKSAHAKKRDEGAEKGTNTHALVEEYVKECIATNDGFSKPELMLTADSNLHAFIKWGSDNEIKFLASEQQVYSKSLFVAGTFDLLFEKEGKRYIGDIKTYKKIWDRVPFYQCAGYAYLWEEMNGKKYIGEIVRVGDCPNHRQTLCTCVWGSEGISKGIALQSNSIDGYCIVNLPKEREFNPEEDVMWSWDTAGDTKAFLACVEIYRQNARFVTPKNKKP